MPRLLAREVDVAGATAAIGLGAAARDAVGAVVARRHLRGVQRALFLRNVIPGDGNDIAPDGDAKGLVARGAGPAPGTNPRARATRHGDLDVHVELAAAPAWGAAIVAAPHPVAIGTTRCRGDVRRC